MPKVSIVLTSYNHENYIRAAIDSVLAQTFTDFELIIWDDASKDSSWTVINSYSDPRITVFRNDEACRAIYGINKAITEVATGEYIAIHHSDDVWQSNKLEKQVECLDSHPEFGAIFTHAQIINERDEAINNGWFDVPNKARHLWLRDLFLKHNHLCHPSVLVRRSAYTQAGLYRYGLPQTGDADMWIRLLQVTEIHVIQEKLTLHRLFTDKSNTSGDKPEIRGRLLLEWYFLKAGFLGIGTDGLLAMFPEARKWMKQEKGDATFILAMMALELGDSPDAALFGLNLLFSLIVVPETAQRIKEFHDFTHFDFIALTGKYDVFLVDCALAVYRLKNEVEVLKNEVEVLKNKVEVLKNEAGVLTKEVEVLKNGIDALHNSISWRVTEPLRIIGKFFNMLTRNAR